MATKEPTNQTSTPQTTELAGRLIRHADNIRNPAAKATLGEDLRAAARALKERSVPAQAPAGTLRDKLVRIAVACTDKETAHALIELAGEDDAGAEPRRA